MTEKEERELRFWSFIEKKDEEGLEALILPETLLVTGGFPMSGEEFKECLGDISLDDFLMEDHEILLETGNVYQTTYTLNLYSTDPEEDTFNGKMAVTSTWKDGHILYLMMTKAAI